MVGTPAGPRDKSPFNLSKIRIRVWMAKHLNNNESEDNRNEQVYESKVFAKVPGKLLLQDK